MDEHEQVIQPQDFLLDASASAPLYMQLKRSLLALVQNGRLAPGTRLPDIKTIAQMANTSVKTVNSALNELIRDRICVRHPKKGTFVGKSLAAMPGMIRKRVCLVHHRTPLHVLEFDNVRVEIIRGIQAGCQENGLDAIFIMGNHLVEDIGFYMSQDNLEILGVMLLEYRGFGKDVHVAEIYPQMRFFYFNEYSPAFELSPRNVYGIFSDDFSGGYAVGEKVAGLGVTRIGLLYPLSFDNENYSRRIAGFKQALADHGCKLPDCLVECKSKLGGTVNNEELIRHVSNLCREMLQAGPLPEAVFVVNDLVAEGAWTELVKMGFEDKVFLFGYDNLLPEISRIHNFSTVDVNFWKMGRRAIDLIVAASYIPKCVFLPPQLISRINK